MAKSTNKKPKSTDDAKVKQGKAEPEIVILERVIPEPKKGKAEKPVETPDTEPNKPEQNRTDDGQPVEPHGRKLALGVLVILMAIGAGFSGWWMMMRGHEKTAEIATSEDVAESELTPEEQAAEAKAEAERQAAEAERQRQEELAEAERQRQAQQAELERQRAEQVAQATTNGRPLVALTFDDGPSGATTPRLLDILKEKNVKATFFVLGNMLSARPDISQRAEAEGHEVESHTMTHANLDKSTVEGVRWEAESMRQLFREKLGHEPSLTRPPYGNGIRRAAVTENIGTPLIYWSVDTLDWKSRNVAAILERVRQDTYDGAMILMHDIYPTTVDAAALAIDELRARGYEFVTVKELAKARGVEMVNGVTYFSFRP